MSDDTLINNRILFYYRIILLTTCKQIPVKTVGNMWTICLYEEVVVANRIKH